MFSRRRRYNRREELELNLIPLIDLLLVILVFLVVSTTYNRFSQLRIRLPVANQHIAHHDIKELNVYVSAAGQYRVGQQSLVYHGISDLAAALQLSRRGGDKILLVINADHLATHQAVVNVMEAAQLSGFDRIAFATEGAH